jgi:hypothetical protein
MWSWPGANVNTLFGESSLICVKTKYSRADVITDDDRVSPPIDNDPADRMVEMPTRRVSAYAAEEAGEGWQSQSGATLEVRLGGLKIRVWRAIGSSCSSNRDAASLI